MIEYQGKLLQIKKDINTTNERVAKLKKRSLTLQQRKNTWEIAQAEKIEKNLQKEKEIEAKPVRSPSNPPPPPISDPSSVQTNTTNTTTTTSPVTTEPKKKVKAKPVILPPPTPQRR